MPETQSYEQQMAAHSRVYLKLLPGKIHSIEDLWLAVRQGDEIDFWLTELHNAVHKLSGSAGIYGLTDDAKALSLLEGIFADLIEKGTRPTPEQTVVIETTISERKRCALARDPGKSICDAGMVVTGKATSASAKRLVLIVDDAEAVRDRLRLTFEASGFDVAEAANGRAALDVIRAHKPDLILMDLKMPEMDGFEAHRRIRSDATLARTPILFMTSSRSFRMDEIQKALKYGISGYLSKTLPLRDIVDKVRSTLQTHTGPVPAN